MLGTLYLCATPIGNLEDITFRVVRTLKEVDIIAAEDTRVSGKLLQHYNIATPMTSYHEHNKHEKGQKLIARLQAGDNIALITDAGTPGISDPGEELVQLCYQHHITVTSLPGAAACITALTLSGLPTRRFVFEAFLPSDKKERNWILEKLAEESRTMVLYEAPHRLCKTLALLQEALGERAITVCRELTKHYETAFRSTFSEALAYYQQTPPKGECVIVIAGKPKQQIQEEGYQKWQTIPLAEHLEQYISDGMDKKQAMKQVADDRGISKRDVYQQLIGRE